MCGTAHSTYHYVYVGHPGIKKQRKNLFLWQNYRLMFGGCFHFIRLLYFDNMSNGAELMRVYQIMRFKLVARSEMPFHRMVLRSGERFGEDFSQRMVHIFSQSELLFILYNKSTCCATYIQKALLQLWIPFRFGISGSIDVSTTHVVYSCSHPCSSPFQIISVKWFVYDIKFEKSKQF